MSKDNRISLPSGQGGLVRYFEESSSKFTFSPATVIILAIIIMVIIILFHQFGGSLLN
jgi:preprotein translocase subunit Sec61beta